MPDLPTLTVTQAQADRMLAAYGSVANYRTWLKEQIVEHVLNTERIEAIEQFRVEQEAKDAQTKAELA